MVAIEVFDLVLDVEIRNNVLVTILVVMFCLSLMRTHVFGALFGRPSTTLAKVYDECADSDCDGCCTKNAKPSGFLIDMEKYTVQKFGSSSGQVNWVCTDC